MALKQLTVLFGQQNYELSIPLTPDTHCHFIDGHEVLTLAVKQAKKIENTRAVVQKEFPWMRENATAG